MSVVNAVKESISDELLADYFLSGKTITRVKAQKNCPKYLRYNPFSANGKNHAPTFNPLKHTA